MDHETSSVKGHEKTIDVGCLLQAIVDEPDSEARDHSCRISL